MKTVEKNKTRQKGDEYKIMFGSDVLNKMTVFVSCFVMMDKIK